MGFVRKTPEGRFRACWRDPAGRQKSKTFRTKKAANGYLADVEGSLNKGTYIDPRAGKVRFGDYALQWLAARNSQITTSARDQSLMRNHVLPRWGAVPLGKIDHLAVQAWVTDLGTRLSPETVAKCHQLTSGVLRAAVRDQLRGHNPCDGVRLPAIRKRDTDDQVVTLDQVTNQLLPAIPVRYRALVGLAAGTGLRWGESVGLRWDAVDLGAGVVRVVRVAVEVAGTVTAKPFPKSKAGRRVVPLMPAVVQLLAEHKRLFPPGPLGEVFTNVAGGPLRRTLFRSRVWRPALVKAGLLGTVADIGEYKYRAAWPDGTGLEWSAEFTTEREAVAHVAKNAAGGLRFHDLRHSYATWLVSSGVPINDIQMVMGHEQASTTLNRYTHGSDDRDGRIRGALAAFLLPPPPAEESKDEEDPSGEGP